jgi:hypothetical protein
MVLAVLLRQQVHQSHNMPLSKFLYITLADSNGDAFGVPLTYNGAARNIESLLKIYRITQERVSSTPWQVTEVPQADVNISVTYGSTLDTLTGAPKNVGRYDYTINITLKSDATYRGYFSTVYGSTPPAGVPAYDDIVKNNVFITDIRTQHPGVFPIRSPDAVFETLVDTIKYLTVAPLSVAITFPSLETKDNKKPQACAYSTSIKILDTAAPNFGSDIPARVTYSGQDSPLAAPKNAGTYAVTVTLTDFNYVGSANAQYVITPRTVADGIADEQLYNSNLQALPSKTRIWIDETGFSDDNAKRDFIQNGILSVVDNANSEILNLDNGLYQQAATIADCARNLPQKLAIIAAAKLVQLAASYVPGLGIVNMLTEVQSRIAQVQKLMELIQFVKDNPWAFANAVLESSGAYAKTGAFVGDQLEKLQAAFPEANNIGQTIKDVAAGVVNVCNLVDTNSGPVARLIKADTRLAPELIPGFNPPVYRQPTVQKTEYDYMLFRLSEPLFKDNEKIQSLKAAGDEAGLRDYITMLGAVHELAYNYHDDIASTAAPVGLLSSSAATSLDETYNNINNVNGILQGIYGAPSGDVLQSTTTSTAGTVTNAVLSGFDRGVNIASAALTGNVKEALLAFSSKYDYSVKATLENHPYWRPETIKEFTDRTNSIRNELKSGTQAIRSNPAFARS